MNIIQEFETERLFLKNIKLTDAPAYQKYFDDYEVIRYLAAHVPWPYPKDGAEQFIKNTIIPNQGKDHWFWGIFLKSEPNELIGVIELWRKTHLGNRGFWLAKKHWNRGIMTEAIKPVTDYAFTHLNFDKLYLGNAIGNHSSRKLKEKQWARLIEVKPMKFVDPNLNQIEIWELTEQNWNLQNITRENK